MTENKRFTYHEEWANSEGDLFHHVITENGEYFAWFHTWYKANLVCDELNNLSKENEDLKRINQKLKKNLKKFYTNEEWELKEALGDFE